MKRQAEAFSLARSNSATLERANQETSKTLAPVKSLTIGRSTISDGGRPGPVSADRVSLLVVGGPRRQSKQRRLVVLRVLPPRSVEAPSSGEPRVDGMDRVCQLANEGAECAGACRPFVSRSGEWSRFSLIPSPLRRFRRQHRREASATRRPFEHCAADGG